jgi:hypothetical protein
MPSLTGTGRNDRITASSADDEGSQIRGLGGDDVLTGLYWDDALFGGDGNDQLDGGDGANRLMGGSGDDRLTYSKHLSMSLWGLEGGLIHAFANVVDGGPGQDTLVLQDFSYSFWQRLFGPVRVDCGVVADLAAETVNVDAEQWSEGFRTDRVTGIENLAGTEWNDVLRGNAGANVLEGAGGNDRLEGGEGDDALLGGAGDDTLLGGAGDDLLDGGAGFDVLLVEELAFSGAVRGLTAEGRLRLGTTEGIDTLSSVEEVRFLDGRLVLDPNAPEVVVARLYHLLLGRGPDPGGLAFWADLLAVEGDLRNLVSGFAESREFAEHDAGSNSLAAALTRLADWAEAATPEISLGVWRPDAEASLVARLYDTLLDRAPDHDSLAAWVAVLKAETGRGLDLADWILSSKEFAHHPGTASKQGFIEHLYVAAFGRAPEAAGLEYWSNALAGGLSRAGLALAVSESPEHLALTRPILADNVFPV